MVRCGVWGLLVGLGVSKPWIVDDGLWERISGLLPVHRPGTRGPVPMDDRLCLQGILFVLYTGTNWEHLPAELGFGSGVTCWRRLKRWSEAGVFDSLHRVLLAELNSAAELDWSRVCIDGGHVRSKRGAMV